jgi:hypothetical protein
MIKRTLLLLLMLLMLLMLMLLLLLSLKGRRSLSVCLPPSSG